MKTIDVRDVFAHGHSENIKAYLKILDPVEVVDLFYLLDKDYYDKLIEHMGKKTTAAVLPFLEEPLVKKVIAKFDNERMIRIFNEMETDDAAYILRNIEEERKYKILPFLEKSDEIEKILSYPDESAGSIMQTEVCLLKDRMSIREAIQSIREQKRELGEVFNTYVVDDANVLKGVVFLDDLILGDFEAPISSIMKPLKYTIEPQKDQEEVVHTFSKNDLSFLPVVDGGHRLLGQITFDDVQEVMTDEVSEDILAYAGVSSEESIIDVDRNKFFLALGRLPWLVFSISASMMTGYVLTFFEGATTNALLYASFVPLVMSTTGNVGTQTAMIITRSFALGMNEFGQFRLPMMREFSVGIILGLLSGLVSFLVVGFIFSDVTVGLRVGTTIVISVFTAVLFGMFIPLGFNKLGIDPAIAAGPLVTSGCDMISVSVYLGIVIAMNKFFPA